jgi:hypothetical protein
MHNGFLAEFPRLRLRMLNFLTPGVFPSVVGTSDSEHMWVGVVRGPLLHGLALTAACTMRRSCRAAHGLRVHCAGVLAPGAGVCV